MPFIGECVELQDQTETSHHQYVSTANGVALRTMQDRVNCPPCPFFIAIAQGTTTSGRESIGFASQSRLQLRRTRR